MKNNKNNKNMKLDEMVKNVLMPETERESLILLGGRPGMGKTAVAMGIAAGLAAQGMKVLYISMEQSVDSWWKRFEVTGSDLKDSGVKNLKVVATGQADVEKIQNICDEKYDLIIIDYLQLIDRGDGSMDDIQVKLRKMADHLHRPVIVLSQLGRSVEDRENHRPVISDLAGGHLDEKMFDEVLLIYREHYYDRTADPADMSVRTKQGEQTLEWNYESLSVI